MCRDFDAQKLSSSAARRRRAVFDGNALDKSSEVLAIEMSKLGYPFAQACPAPSATPNQAASTSPL